MYAYISRLNHMASKIDNSFSEGKTICFTFKRFALETSTPFCSYDYMKFGDIKYCGRGLWQYGIVTTRTESTVWFENFCCEYSARILLRVHKSNPFCKVRLNYLKLHADSLLMPGIRTIQWIYKTGTFPL